MKLVSAIAVSVLSLLASACGEDSSTATPTTVTSPGTVPPTTVSSQPTVAPTPTDAPPGQPPALPSRPVEVDDGAFDALSDMGAGADVVVGVVREESSLGRPMSDQDPAADEYLGLVIEVESVLKGGPIDEVRLAWDAYGVDVEGTRTSSNLMNGIPVPHVGERLVLFLRPVDGQYAALFDGFPSHAPVALDGVGFVVDWVVTITDTTAADAAHLTGMTVEEIAAQL